MRRISPYPQDRAVTAFRKFAAWGRWLLVLHLTVHIRLPTAASAADGHGLGTVYLFAVVDLGRGVLVSVLYTLR